MGRPRLLPFLVASLVALSLLAPVRADARTRRKKRPRRASRPPVTRPYQGPPAPTPEAFLRAAGACVEFSPGRHLVVAEVGATGHVFRVDARTSIEADVRKGARVRVLYVEGPEGPLARKVLPGPVAADPAPRAP